ncbi:MAG TPA: GAF domain-containing protein [Opitutaceae bacterium]|jgi:CheY-like chemotaxis protein
MRLLLVEDSDTDALLLERLLRMALGADVVRVGSLAAAQAAMDPLPDVVLTDLHLPDGENTAVVKHLHSAHPAVPLIVLTGGDERVALSCLRIGAQDHLSKNELSTVAVAKSVLFAIQRKQHELELESELMEIIAAQEEAMTLMGDYDHMLEAICQRTQRMLPATGVVVELPEDDCIVYRACSGSAVAHLGLRIKAQGSLSGMSLESGEILRCDDSETDPRVDREACRRVQARSMVVVPLKSPSGTLGVLKAVSTEADAFSNLDVGKLRVLSGLLARVLHQANLYAELQELKRAAAAVVPL